MVRRLTLLRHAKSSWQDATLPDYERPLNERGERDAPMMGKRLQTRDARPSLILVSPARRARRTAQLIAREIGYPTEFLQPEEELYLASPEQIITVVARQQSSFRELLVCGHNPGLTDLANLLTEARIDNVPTCGVVALDLDTRSWGELGPGKAQLAYFDFPKKSPRD